MPYLHGEANCGRDGVFGNSGNPSSRLGRQVFKIIRFAKQTLYIVFLGVGGRNCLVEANYGVKIASFGIHSKRYPADYFAMDDGRCVPLRWMAWESVALVRIAS